MPQNAPGVIGVKMRFLLVILWVMLALMGCGEGENMDNFTYTQQKVIASPNISGYGVFGFASDTSIIIPGLAECYVPQGIAHWKQRGWLLISGYFQPLREVQSAIVFALDAATGDLVGEFSLVKRGGEAVGGHFSGIAVTEQELVVVQEKELYRLSLQKIPKEGKAVLEVDGEIHLPHSADFCNYAQGMLWIGEHHNPYRKDGTAQIALLVGYSISQGEEPAATCALTIPDRIQGVTLLADGRFLLSQSYGRRNASHMLIFADPRMVAPRSVIALGEIAVPLWRLDDQYALADLSAPPMAEGCCAAGMGAYLIFESAAYYYRAMNASDRAIHPIDTVWYLEIK